MREDPRRRCRFLCPCASIGNIPRLASIRNGGTFVEIGDIVRGREVSIDPSKLLAGKNILGSLMYRPSLLPTLLDYLARNRYKLPFHTIISHKFPLVEVNAAFEKAEWNQRQTDITRAVLVP